VISKKILAPASLKGVDLENPGGNRGQSGHSLLAGRSESRFPGARSSPGSPDDVQILLAAARKEKVEDRVAAVEAAGLKALIMDVESFATQTAYEQIATCCQQRRRQTVAIIDVGAQNMHINILNNNESVYLREHVLAATSSTTKFPPLRHDQRGSRKRKRKGTLPESYDMEVLQPFSETMAMGNRSRLQLFTTSTQYRKVDQILLAGGGAMIPGIDEWLPSVPAPRRWSSTRLPTWHRLKIRPQALTADAPSLFVACGLAMRRFDPQ